MPTAAGSTVCGAAAVLGTEPVIRAKPYEGSFAVGAVWLMVSGYWISKFMTDMSL